MKYFFSILTVCFCMTFLSSGCKKTDSPESTYTPPPPTITLPVVTTAAVTDVTQTKAKCGGTVVSDGGETPGYSICWSTFPNPVRTGMHGWELGGVGSFIDSMTGLALNTKYYVRAYAFNSAGIAYGDNVSFTTSAVVPPTVTTTPVTFIRNTNASSGGTIVSNGGGAIIHYGLCFSTYPHPTIANEANLVSTLSGNWFDATMTPLAAFTKYYVRAYAENSAGITYGNEITFTTTYVEGYDYGGGTVFYVDLTGQHGLIAAKSDQSAGATWWNGDYVTTNASSFTDGATNTTHIIAAQGNYGTYAAKICRDYRGGGYSDWFLPAHDQLETLYAKNYLVGGFYDAPYWSSSDKGNNSYAFYRSFQDNTLPYYQYSLYSYRVRAIRSF